MRAARQRKCRVCRATYRPASTLQAVCSPTCAMEYVRIANRHAARIQTAADRRRLMTRRDWQKRAQTAFNAYIRERDKNQPCICCGKPLTVSAPTGGGYDAGHYRSVGSAPHMRFVEDNCHAQRKVCNQFGAGRAVDYRIGLIRRIGIERVEALEADQAPRKYTAEELQAIERTYKNKLKELKR